MQIPLLLALAFSGAANLDQPVDESLLASIDNSANQHVAVSELKLQIAERRLRQLETLHSLGHASPKEVALAATATKAALANYEAYSEFRNITKTALTTASPVSPPANVVLVRIPGLTGNDDSSFSGLFKLTFSSSKDWTTIANQLQNYPVSRNRSAAWRQLAERLSAGTPSPSSANEQEITRLRHLLAVAEEDLESCRFRPLRLCRSLDELQLSGRIFQDEAVLSTFLDSRRERLLSEADQKTIDAVLNQLSEAVRKSKAIAKQDPAFAGEAQVLEYRLGQVQAHRSAMAQTLQTQKATSVVVSYSPGSNPPPFVETPSQQQLDTSYTATRRRVDAAQQAVIATRAIFRKAESDAAKITELAGRDRFFSKEAEVKTFDSQIAKATWKAAENRLDLRRAELAFVHAAASSAGSKKQQQQFDWVAPLTKIFELRSDSSALVQLEEARIAKYEDTHQALIQLRKAGHASWKEVAGAEVRLNEALHQLTQVRLQCKIYGQIFECLKSKVKLQAAEVALAN